jgi:shikimate kinase
MSNPTFNLPGPIVLTGFMAAGKTTLARDIARALNAVALDLDELIVRQQGCSIATLINSRGEEDFRQIETNALTELLSQHPTCVIALGGGTWTIPRNRDLIKGNNGISVWLDIDFETCWTRILEAGATRPLARDRASAKTLFDERRAIYQTADIHFRMPDGESTASIASMIITLLRETALKSNPG